MNYTASFMESVDAFLAETKMPATRLGVEAIKDPNFVSDLKAGRAPSSRLMDRVAEYMRDYRASQDKQAEPQRASA